MLPPCPLRARTKQRLGDQSKTARRDSTRPQARVCVIGNPTDLLDQNPEVEWVHEKGKVGRPWVTGQGFNPITLGTMGSSGEFGVGVGKCRGKS